MSYDWNSAKRDSNLVKHGIDFGSAEDFEWPTAFVVADMRHDYGEVRLKAVGMLGDRLHVLIYTIRRTTWIISLRRASNTEMDDYEAQD